MIFTVDLDAIYSMPCRGSQRAFNLDIPEMSLAEIQADIYAARQRLIFEADMLNRSYLRQRLYLLAARGAKLRRAA
ncbi:MAG: hypothetical protein M0Z32_04880 [Actinomycetota bacterium]|nr:hypothetical protein [Actinomycetota bacterium]MCL6094170.1 hypothetical protein [Actinomycetota bacterium]MDA8167073.1 hypothetical protein [Actinomycetota bacterium]